MKRLALISILLILCMALVHAQSGEQPQLPELEDMNLTEGNAQSISINLTEGPDNGSAVFSLNGTGANYTMAFGPHSANLTQYNDTHAELTFDSVLVNADQNYTLNISVNDTNSSDYQEMQVNVANQPTGPNISAISNKQVDENDNLQFTVSTVSGPDNGSTTWSLANNSLGSLSNEDNTTAMFSYSAPLVSSNQQYEQTIYAGDDDSQSNSSFSITVNDVGGGFSLSDITFGDDDQERSNHQLDDDEDDYERNTTATFTLQNTNPETAENVTVSWPSDSNYDISYESIAQPKTVTENDNSIEIDSIASDETVDVTLEARVPEDLNSYFGDVDNPSDQQEEDLGTLYANAEGFDQATGDVRMQAENMLTIEELDISVDGDSDDYSDGDEVSEVSPGDEITIDLEAENHFSSGDEIQIEDVEFAFYADDSDLDVEEETGIGDLDTGDSNTESLSFQLDDDIDEDTYNVYIILMGDDENGATHGEQWELDFEVQTPDEKIDIERLNLDRSSLTLCDDRPQTTLNVRMENNGKDDADEAALTVDNSMLNIELQRTLIELEEGDSEDYSFTLTMPSDATAGTYQIVARSYFDMDDFEDEDRNDFRSTELTLTECPTQQEPDETDEEENETNDSGQNDSVVVVEEPAPEENRTQAEPVTQPEQTESEQFDTLYFVGIGAAYLIVLLAIILLLVKALQEPAQPQRRSRRR